MATKAEEIARLEAELNAIREAKTAIAEGGQSVSIGDMSYTEANFSALAAHEKSVVSELARVNGTRPRIVKVDLGGMYR